MGETNILGISCYYHDSSAALVKNGVVVAAAQEERFTGKKHDTSFPLNAAKFCLDSQGMTIGDIDHIAFYEKPVLKFDRFLSQSIEGFPETAKMFLRAVPFWFTEKLRVPRIVNKKLNYKGNIFFIEHHLSHAAASFLPSPFSNAAIVSVDGVGEWATTTWGEGENNAINLSGQINFPHSLGLFYSTMTAFLGFKVNNDESKIMALRAYGEENKEKNKFYKKLKQVVEIRKNGSFALDMKYFSYHRGLKMPSAELSQLLDCPVRKKEERLKQKHKDIAAAGQMVYEEALFNLLNHVQKETGRKNIVIGGGCGLNSVANGKIINKTRFENIWIPPSPGDGGTSAGAALYAYKCILKKERKFIMKNAYLGPSFTNEEIKNFLKENKIIYHAFKNEEEIVAKTAKLIDENNIIGWFQGKMEWGPRALGNRSILGNPCNLRAKNRLLKIKERENFRPLCPVVCREDAHKYFHCDNPLPESTDFITMVYKVKEDWRKRIPAVVHVDGTAGLQTIKEKDNPLYYNLIKKFEKLSGIPVIVNTSFNLGGKPIVNTPRDAYDCMMKTGIDCLVIGNYLVYKKENSN